MIEEIQPTKADLALSAFKSTRDREDQEAGSVTDINSKVVRKERVSFARSEIGRDFTRADIQAAKKRRRLRQLHEDCESAIREGYKAGKNLNDIKRDLITAIGLREGSV